MVKLFSYGISLLLSSQIIRVSNIIIPLPKTFYIPDVKPSNFFISIILNKFLYLLILGFKVHKIELFFILIYLIQVIDETLIPEDSVVGRYQ